MPMRTPIWTAAILASSIAACATGPGGETVSSDTPPSPPPPPVIAAEPAPEAIVVTGAKRDARADTEVSGTIAADELSTPLPLSEFETNPDAQAGLLTAGDYDDVLNPELYKRYVDKMLQGELAGKDLPFIDADRRISISVIDSIGEPIPLSKIALRDANGSPMFPLKTGADGMAYLYPHYDALSEGMSITVSVDGQPPLSRTLSSQSLREGGAVEFQFAGNAASVQQLDLLLTLDATGSMSDEMAYLQVELVAILDRLRDSHPQLDIRAGFIVYRDKGDAYIVRETAFTNSLVDFKAEFEKQSSQGGGDFPEAMHDALAAGLNFEWREEAIKINLLVADAPPHDEDISATWDSALISRSRGIHIAPIAASGVDKTAEFLMRGMAQLTASRYMFLTDDSGIGNAHAEPTVDCYVVTRLDHLVLRVLEDLVMGTRIEPNKDEVIRQTGDYQNGKCLLNPPETQ
ncbi:MAG: hypothetical protein Hens3KO_28370 [Henriciella sp.]